MTHYLAIAGLSGAGRSTAAAVLEDLGWFVIDNLPPALIPKVAELAGRSAADGNENEQRVALVIGRAADHLEDVVPALNALREGGCQVKILFLEASEEVLVRRFEGTRRRHPLPSGGVSSAIAAERELLQPLKDAADLVVDTSELNVHELRARLVSLFERDASSGHLQTSVLSFGFKHGTPRDVDLVFDCRFLPNPHWIEELRPYSGLDAPVQDYVLAQEDTKAFLDKLDDMMGLLLPGYVREGKSYLAIAIGCTGGRHRSVVVAEQLAKAMRERGFEPNVTHRDIMR